MKIDRQALLDFMVPERREFHRHAESGFTEFWTASRVAGHLREAGYTLRVGREIMSAEHRMGLPPEAVLDSCRDRALAEGADPAFLEKMQGGFTAVAGEMHNGDGLVIGFRFDMDAVDVEESTAQEHLPAREGFASLHKGSMHACGHDAHTVTGLALARLLAENRDSWRGTVKLVFQPAEEGVRGARSIAESGYLDDVDYMIAGHIGLVPDGADTFYSGVGGFLSTTKLDFHFAGRAAHAGGNPELGKSALLAAASTALHLQGIPRHSGGATRINVGRMEGGSGRNVIPEKAFLAIETRGETTAINEYMSAEAARIAEGIAAAYGVGLRVERMGEAAGGDSDRELMALAEECAREAGYARVVGTPLPLGGSEDYSFMMNRVQAHGGKAVFVIFGTKLSDAHHASKFDFRESDLPNGAVTFALMTQKLTMP